MSPSLEAPQKSSPRTPVAGAGARLAPTHIRVATEFGTAYQPPGSGSYRGLTWRKARITLSGLVSGSESDDLGLRVAGGQWSDREIARRCVVDHKTVGKVRSSLVESTSETARIVPTKHGTVTTMDISRIGGRKRRAAVETALIENPGITNQQVVEMTGGSLASARCRHLRAGRFHREQGAHSQGGGGTGEGVEKQPSAPLYHPKVTHGPRQTVVELQLHRSKLLTMRSLGAVTRGSAYGIRTRVTGVRGRRPGPLDERAPRTAYLSKGGRLSAKTGGSCSCLSAVTIFRAPVKGPACSGQTPCRPSGGRQRRRPLHRQI